MSTQIPAGHNNFANQATEFQTLATNKGKSSIDEESNNVSQEPERADNKVNKFQDQQTVTKKLLKNEEGLSENEKTLVIDDALELIADFMKLSSRNINFQQDDISDKTVIKFFDTESKELIKQFPTEEVLEIAQKIVALRQDVGEKTGIFLEEKV